ncbi:hypothetical protein GC194_11160 [bacterium]|nr:hypothetical protein [bacterium]
MKTFTLVSTLFMLTVISACNLDMNWPGVCESKMSTTSGNTYYYCETSESADVCESSNIGSHHYSSESCKNLGYTEKGGSSVSWKDGDVYFISPDGANTPGSNGYYSGGGSSSGGSSSGGGGGGANCDMSNYKGPEFNVQIDSQCKTAYLYDCAGETDHRDVACRLYYEWDDGSGSFPKCPYCP